MIADYSKALVACGLWLVACGLWLVAGELCSADRQRRADPNLASRARVRCPLGRYIRVERTVGNVGEDLLTPLLGQVDNAGFSRPAW